MNYIFVSMPRCVQAISIELTIVGSYDSENAAPINEASASISNEERFAMFLRGA